MFKNYKVPAKEEDYLKGIIRNNIIRIKATASHYSYPLDEKALAGNDYSKYWHSIHDSTFSQYVQIDFLKIFVEASSYMFSTGNNGKKGRNFCISKNWNVSCSLDCKEWIYIDDHTEETKVQLPQQKVIFNMKTIKACRSFRFYISGTDNCSRYYGYIGPIELYGKTFRITSCQYHSTKRSISSIALILLSFVVS